MSEKRAVRYEAVATALREAIQGRQISIDTLLPTERELQERYGVSRTTVRRALSELIATGWAENLPNRGVIAKMGHVPGDSRKVAYIDHRELIHTYLFFELSRLLGDAGYHLIPVDSHDIGTVQAMANCADREFAAAFVWSKNAFPDRKLVAEIQTKMAIVAIDHSLDGPDSDVVMPDHFDAARQVVSHLIAQGRRRIAISGMLTHLDDASERYAGYVKAHYDHGLNLHASDLVFSSPNHPEVEDVRLLRYRLAEPDRPDAIFVLHDMSVPVVVAAVQDAGLRVPEDVAVVGIGNDLPYVIGEVGLTTVALNWKLVAVELVKRLQARLSHPAARYVRTTVPVELVVRGSCGAPPEAWSDYPYQPSSVTVTGRIPSYLARPGA